MTQPWNDPGLIYRISHFLCWIFFLGLWRCRRRTRDTVPTSGSVLLASNHQSYLDPVLVGAFTRRTLHYMARDTLFHKRAFAWLIRKYHAFPVKRSTADLTAIKQSLRLLGDGNALLLFPEGTRTSDGKVHHMQAGVIALARRSRSPIIPAAVEGMFEAWPRTRRFPRWMPIQLAYGQPITPEEIDALDDAEAAARLTRVVRDLHNDLRKRAGREPFEYADEQEKEGLKKAERRTE